MHLGVSDLQNSWWPRSPLDFGDGGYAALEMASVMGSNSISQEESRLYK